MIRYIIFFALILTACDGSRLADVSHPGLTNVRVSPIAIHDKEKVVRIHNGWGGDLFKHYDFAKWIAENGFRIELLDDCFSACTILVETAFRIGADVCVTGRPRLYMHHAKGGYKVTSYYRPELLSAANRPIPTYESQLWSVVDNDALNNLYRGCD